MFARQPVVFEDHEFSKQAGINSKAATGQASAGGSLVQSSKLKRKALANITNAKTDGAGSTATDKNSSQQETVKLPVALPSAAVSADGHLETPEKLAMPSVTDQEITDDEDNQLEYRVQRILQAIEGAAEDGICDFARDDEEELQGICDTNPDESGDEIALDMFCTLPDMMAPNFLNLVD